jgi:hypothetical protein
MGRMMASSVHRPPREEIAKLAYCMWEGCGKPYGEEMSIVIWLIAENFCFLHAFLMNKSSRNRERES